jgi:hypothetical protein
LPGVAAASVISTTSPTAFDLSLVTTPVSTSTSAISPNSS